jgi:hypothetical protein
LPIPIPIPNIQYPYTNTTHIRYLDLNSLLDARCTIALIACLFIAYVSTQATDLVDALSPKAAALDVR